MTDWVRLWHDMPTDPKWRVIARKSGQPLTCVIALFTLMMTTASAADDRGSIGSLSVEDAAAALDMDEDQVTAILSAMDGRVMIEGRLSGWERRQPKREDDSAKRVKEFRKRKAEQVERDVTQGNAPDTEENREDNTPPTPPRGGKGKTLLTSDWELPEVDALPPKARACAQQWTKASYDTHGEAFISYWVSRRTMQADWRLTWANRIVALHSQVLRDQKFGNAPASDAATQSSVLDRVRSDLERSKTRQRTESTGPPRAIGQIVKDVDQIGRR